MGKSIHLALQTSNSRARDCTQAQIGRSAESKVEKSGYLIRTASVGKVRRQEIYSTKTKSKIHFKLFTDTSNKVQMNEAISVVAIFLNPFIIASHPLTFNVTVWNVDAN